MLVVIEVLSGILAIVGFIALIRQIYRSVNDRYDGVTYKTYIKDLSSNEFLQWRTDYLKKYYEDISFINMFGKPYPVKNYPSKGEKYPFSKIASSSLSTTEIVQEKPILTTSQKVFLKKIDSVVKRPQSIGYAIDTIHFDNEGYFESFTSKPCTFIQTLTTCFSLEYEVYKQFLKARSRDALEISLPERDAMHQGLPIEHIFNSGANRMAMLSVQSLVMFKNHTDEVYKTIIAKRSEKVSYSPNTWQFIPCGYFEQYDPGNSKFVIENNFDPVLAILRELLEELFNLEEFTQNDDGAPLQQITNHDVSLYLIEMLKDGRAEFIFLGSVFDIVTLTHKLSYLLIVDDIEFSKSHFQPNFEIRNMQLVPIAEIVNLIEDDFLMPESAGLLNLVLDNENVQSRIN